MLTLRSQTFGVVLSLFIVIVTSLLWQLTPADKEARRMQEAQVVSSTQIDTSVTIHASDLVDCEVNPQTNVIFNITPAEGASVSVYDAGATRLFATTSEEGLDGYFSNGTYQAIVTANQGYTLITPKLITFSLSSSCSGTPSSTLTTAQPSPVPLPTPSISKTVTTLTTNTTTSLTSAPLVLTNIHDATATPTLASTTSTCDSDASCAHVCGNAITCQTYIDKLVVASSSSSDTLMEEYFVERVGARVYIDSDKDGISDFDEVNIYKTDPKVSDTDHDGTNDGDEILAQHDPRMSSATATISFEDPRKVVATTTTALSVNTIAPTATSTDARGIVHLTGVTFSGEAPANSIVTLFIFSDPIIVTVKADDSGAWTYTLDKEIPDGSHEVYSAIADANGRVLAKSLPLPFVKEAQAISVGRATLLPSNEQPGFFTANSLVAMIVFLILAIILAFVLIGFITGKKEGDGEPPLPSA